MIAFLLSLSVSVIALILGCIDVPNTIPIWFNLIIYVVYGLIVKDFAFFGPLATLIAFTLCYIGERFIAIPFECVMILTSFTFTL